MSQVPSPYVRRAHPTQGGTYHRHVDGSLLLTAAPAPAPRHKPGKAAKAVKKPTHRKTKLTT